MRLNLLMTGLILCAVPAAAQNVDTPVAGLLLETYSGTSQVDFDQYKTDTAKIEQIDLNSGKVRSSKRLEKSDLTPFVRDCTLFNFGEGEGVQWHLSWKCKDQYLLMDFITEAGKVTGVKVSEGPPWLVRGNVDDIRFPHMVEE